MNQVPIYAAEIVRDLLVVVMSINEHAPCRGALMMMLIENAARDINIRESSRKWKESKRDHVGVLRCGAGA